MKRSTASAVLVQQEMEQNKVLAWVNAPSSKQPQSGMVFDPNECDKHPCPKFNHFTVMELESREEIDEKNAENISRR